MVIYYCRLGDQILLSRNTWILHMWASSVSSILVMELGSLRSMVVLLLIVRFDLFIWSMMMYG